MSNYRWNTYDPATQWGIYFGKGTDAELLKAPKLKDNGLSINWAGENGTERYLGTRRFESRTLVIPCTLMATSESDFHTKYNALCDFLMTTGEFNFDIVSRNRRYKVSYQDMTGVRKLGTFRSGKVGFEFNLVLVDDHPTERFAITT
ncbi:hypothetical protein [Parapedobacter soli]|uniref:hypothetical protein n=1 Tax=Parapedobacter soli TaxID=416955 RepID=UPI0021C5AB69|nr:hypothetical protein [Parapedobacter soli]